MRTCLALGDLSMSRTALAALSRRSGSSIPFTLASSLSLASHSAVGNAHNPRDADACCPQYFNISIFELRRCFAQTPIPVTRTPIGKNNEFKLRVGLDWQRYRSLFCRVQLMAATLHSLVRFAPNRIVLCAVFYADHST